MQRSKAIDILRALAVFLVLGRHMIPVASAGPSIPGYFAHSFTTLWVRGGWIGVDLFFVLSGFLVSGLLFRGHQKFGVLSGKDFLIRRGLKIYPRVLAPNRGYSCCFWFFFPDKRVQVLFGLFHSPLFFLQHCP
jgi:peptidoglycan/LPS O-acetylase OafA/YrhL